MPITVRPAVPADGPAIGQVKVETWRCAYEHILDPSVLASLDVAQEGVKWRDRLAEFSDKEKAWVACEDQRVIGYVVVGPNRFPEAPCDGELQAIYVLPQYHGKGVGRLLMKPAVSWMIERDFESMAVFVFRDNPIGVGFYKSLGAEFHDSGSLEIAGKQYADESYIWRSLRKLSSDLERT